MPRPIEDICRDIHDARARLDALQIELRDATVLVYVAGYNYDIVGGEIIYVPAETAAIGRIIAVTCLLDAQRQFVSCDYDDDELVNLEIDGSPCRLHGDFTRLRAFTSKERAEQCLNLWVESYGGRDLD